MAHPLVVHCKVKRYDVYVGRPSKWGNPFQIGLDGSRYDVLRKYREYLKAHPELVEMARLELKGRVLGCWCAPRACHADMLAEAANE